MQFNRVADKRDLSISPLPLKGNFIAEMYKYFSFSVVACGLPNLNRPKTDKSMTTRGVTTLLHNEAVT